MDRMPGDLGSTSWISHGGLLCSANCNERRFLRFQRYHRKLEMGGRLLFSSETRQASRTARTRATPSSNPRSNGKKGPQLRRSAGGQFVITANLTWPVTVLRPDWVQML